MGFKLENILPGKIAGERKRERERRVKIFISSSIRASFTSLTRTWNFLSIRSGVSCLFSKTFLISKRHCVTKPRKKPSPAEKELPRSALACVFPGSPGMPVIMAQSTGG